MSEVVEQRGKVRKNRRHKIGVKGLLTLRQVTIETRRVYAECGNGTFEGGWPAGGTAIRALERLRYAIAASDYEGRLDRLEAHITRQRGIWPAGRFIGVDEHDDDVDRDDRHGVLQ